MPIESDNPTIVPAQPEKTFSQWWVNDLHVIGGDINGPVKITAVLTKISRDDNGVGEALESSRTSFEIDDLFALAATDATVASVMTNLLSTLGTLAKAAGKIN